MIREGAKLSGGEWEVGSWRTIKQLAAPHTPQSGRTPEVGTIQLPKRNGCREQLGQDQDQAEPWAPPSSSSDPDPGSRIVLIWQ